MVFECSEVDWEFVANMSLHVSSVIDEFGLQKYTYASKFVRVLGQELKHPAYSINDLSILICLLKDFRLDD